MKIAVIGSGCSVATEATADISHYFNITHVRNILYSIRLVYDQLIFIVCQFLLAYMHTLPCTQISCVSSSTGLANRVKFRYYFQLVPTEASIAPAYFGVIRQYGWKRIGLIVQNENLFTVVWVIVKAINWIDCMEFSRTTYIILVQHNMRYIQVPTPTSIAFTIM